MGVPASVTDVSFKYSDEFTSTVYETENGDFIGLNLKNEIEMCEQVQKILQILQGDYYDGYVPYPYEVRRVRAVSIENAEGNLQLWWRGVTERTPHSFDIFLLPGG